VGADFLKGVREGLCLHGLAVEGVRLVECTEEALGARLERKWWVACCDLGLCGGPWRGSMPRGIRRCWMRSGRGIAPR
jgi:hypothetical protein